MTIANKRVGPEYRYGPGIDAALKSMTVIQVLARARRRCEKCEVPETGSRGNYILHIIFKDGNRRNTDLDNLTLICPECRGPVRTPQITTRFEETTRDWETTEATRLSPKIERVTDALLRNRIERIKPRPVEMCVKYLYVIDGRISEAVSLAYPSDRRTTPRGPVGTDAKIDVWYPDRFATKEEAFKAQKDDGVRRLFPAAVFSVATAKRRGRLRTCAVPLDPSMEPWAQELVMYFEEHGNNHVFPMTRQRVWERSKKVWKDLTYVIEDYSVVLSKGGTGIERIDTKTTEEKRKTKRVDRHLRDWTLHACRHLRASDLVDQYNFTGANLSSFGGWSTATAMRVSSSVGRYLDLDWRAYVSKLLKPRYDM